MPDLPEEAVQAAADDLMEAFANVPFRFWTCLNKTHKDVTWNGDVASCDTCGLTSTMKDAWTRLVRADERRKVAESLRALAGKCRAIPDKGLNLGQIWQRDEQAREYDRIADMIEKETARDSR